MTFTIFTCKISSIETIVLLALGILLEAQVGGVDGPKKYHKDHFTTAFGHTLGGPNRGCGWTCSWNQGKVRCFKKGGRGGRRDPYRWAWNVGTPVEPNWKKKNYFFLDVGWGTTHPPPRFEDDFEEVKNVGGFNPLASSPAAPLQSPFPKQPELSGDPPHT